MAEQIAWATLLRLGLSRLKLDPERFWSLTPVEFMLMAGIEDTNSLGMTQARLAALEARYPDATRLGSEE